MAAGRWLGAGLLIAAHFLAHAADEAKSPFKPNDVEVRLRDGSIVNGEIRLTDELRLQTAYGLLVFPVNSLACLRPGQRLPQQEALNIQAAIKDLEHDDFSKRNDAQRNLEAFGARAMDLLRQSRAGASAEGRYRIDAVINKIVSKNAPPLQTDDWVQAQDFQAQGFLQTETLALASRVGNLDIKLSEIDSVRWLCRGAQKVFSLDADAAIRDWIDTEVDLSPGEKTVVSCSGTITLFNSGHSSSPTGTRNWNSGKFLPGCVIAKLGQNGKPFSIGFNKQWVSEKKERLFLKIYCPENVLSSYGSQMSSGEYRTRIATGSWASQPDKAAENPVDGD